MSSDMLLPLIALSAGIKHGVDWDHIAAIMDITSTQQSRRKGIFLGFLYAVGHASVVAALALGALIVGVSLPEGVDGIMEKVVGITLLLLGIYVFYALKRYKGDDFRMLPRWALLANAVLRAYGWVEAKITRAPVKHRQVLKSGYGNTSSYIIGMIHGIGAETPTQVLLFTLALGAGVASGIEIGTILILAFALGLVVTNTTMAVLGVYGYVGSSNKHKIYRTAALVTGTFSLLLGIVFIFGGTGYLPELQALLGQ
ncbi:HoxN/HupN/NixA family nickel/cobalt transporter [Candidatus Pyrohabitans sp.]